MKSDADLISEFIAAHGVTRCPAAALIATQADIVPADQADDRVGRAWRKKNPGRFRKKLKLWQDQLRGLKGGRRTCRT